jgi:hypothetical protein
MARNNVGALVVLRPVGSAYRIRANPEQQLSGTRRGDRTLDELDLSPS